MVFTGIQKCLIFRGKRFPIGKKYDGFVYFLINSQMQHVFLFASPNERFVVPDQQAYSML